MNLFERNLNKYGQLITLQERTSVQASFGESDPGQSFADVATVLAITKTPSGKRIFDNTGIDPDMANTNEFCLNYIAGITQENWVLFKNHRYDIERVENVCEQDERLILYCRDRGGESASEG